MVLPEKGKPAPVLRIDVDDRVVQSGLLATVPQILELDQPLKRRLGEGKYILLSHYVTGLLQGGSFPLQEIVDKKLDPELIRKKARNILRGFLTRITDVERVERNMSKAKPPSKEDIVLQDPNAFLGDGGGRKGLGYIQSQREHD